MAKYIDEIPYMKTVLMKHALPKGYPIKYGNLVFLYSRSVDDSIKMINNPTVYNLNSFMYYYYNTLYTGYVKNKRYYIKDIDGRNIAYNKIKTSTNITPHPIRPLGTVGQASNGAYKNTYFELSKYLEIFYEKSVNIPIIMRIHIFWDWLGNILFNESTNKYKKYLLIDASMYPYKSSQKIDKSFENPLFVLYYTMKRFPELLGAMDIDVIIYGENKILKLNPSHYAEKGTSYNIYNRELNKVMWSIDFSASANDVDKVINTEDIAKTIVNKYKFVGDGQETETDDELSKTIEDKINRKVEEVTEELNKQSKIEDADAAASNELVEDGVGDDSSKKKVVEELVKDEMSTDESLIRDIYNYNNRNKPAKSTASTARDKLLREQQKRVQVANTTIEDLEKIKVENVQIPTKDISHAVKTPNPDMHQVKFANIEKAYNEKVLQKDITDAFLSLNDKSTPMQIIKYDIFDSSDNLNYKETHRVVLEDSNRVRHTITVDIPKFYDDKFLYLGGNKKVIAHQDFFYPIVKTGPTTVQIVSNYMKLFIRRIDTKSIGDVEKLFALIAREPKFQKYITFGNVHTYNLGLVSNLEYDELSRRITKFSGKGVTIYFKRIDANEAYKKKFGRDFKPGKDGEFVIGFKNNNSEPIIISPDSNSNICRMMLVDDEFLNEFNHMAQRKRLMYTNATIMAQAIPLVTLIGLWIGLDGVMKKLDVDYKFSDKKINDPNMTMITLADGYLYYDASNIRAELLLNGLVNMRPWQYTYEELNTKTPYIEYFTSVYGKASIVNPLMTAYEFFIGPIELEILKDLNLPTDIVSLCLYANTLLCDNDYTPENSFKLKRIRSNEIVPAILYSLIAQHYTAFKNAGPKSKLSIPRDAVIKQILALQTVEDYSTLNPVVEMSKTRNVSSKGFRGVNLEESYTFEKRQYDPSMVGVAAATTSPDANVGVTRDLALEPRINSVRGYMDNNMPIDKMSSANLYSPGEMAITMGSTHDDAIRTSIGKQQTCHEVPTIKSSPVLISNGADEIFRFNLSSDFVVNADEDGKVVEYDEDTQLMVVEYKSGKVRAIDLSNHIVKNGAGGFYLPNQLATNLKVGDKFKKDDCLAYHSKFFTQSNINGTRMSIGPLAKVAIMSSYDTYEDSAAVTHKLSDDLSAEMIFCDPATVSANSNIYKIAKVGDHVNIGDSLLQFDTSYDDTTGLNKFLATLNDEQKNLVEDISKNNIKARHSGVITDIKIYCTVELDQLSDSLRKIVKAYYNKIEKKDKLLSKYDNSNPVVKCGVLLTESAKKTDPNVYGVIKGQKVMDGVLFEFYIQHVDVFGVGDKLVWFTALKGVCCEVIPEGYEPYSEFRPEEEVSGTISENAILARMTPSIILTVIGNKLQIELKRKLEEIYLQPES